MQLLRMVWTLQVEVILRGSDVFSLYLEADWNAQVANQRKRRNPYKKGQLRSSGKKMFLPA